MTSLVKKIDEASKKTGIKSFVVYLSDDEKLKDQIVSLAEKEGLLPPKDKKAGIVLAIDNPTGPGDYNIAKDADVTVLLYTGRKVQSNFAFRKGELNEAAITRIVADLSKIEPKKK